MMLDSTIRFSDISPVPPEMLDSALHGGGGYDGPGTDVWSLGCVHFEMLTGRVPFDNPNRGKLFQKIRAGKFQLPEASISKEGCDLLSKVGFLLSKGAHHVSGLTRKITQGGSGLLPFGRFYVYHCPAGITLGFWCCIAIFTTLCVQYARGRGVFMFRFLSESAQKNFCADSVSIKFWTVEQLCRAIAQ